MPTLGPTPNLEPGLRLIFFVFGFHPSLSWCREKFGWSKTYAELGLGSKFEIGWKFGVFFGSIQAFFDVERSSNGVKKKPSLGLAPNSKLGPSLVFFLFAPSKLLLMP